MKYEVKYTKQFPLMPFSSKESQITSFIIANKYQIEQECGSTANNFVSKEGAKVCIYYKTKSNVTFLATPSYTYTKSSLQQFINWLIDIEREML